MCLNGSRQAVYNPSKSLDYKGNVLAILSLFHKTQDEGQMGIRFPNEHNYRSEKMLSYTLVCKYYLEEISCLLEKLCVDKFYLPQILEVYAPRKC